MAFKNDPKAKRYYWLKLKHDFFEQKEIKLLRRIAGGDTYTIIYMKMLLKSLQDNGLLYFEAVGDDFTEELALDLDEDTENVAITLQYLVSKKLLEVVEQDEYFLNRVPEMVGSEAYSTERSRRHRANKKQEMLQTNNNETSMQHDATKRIEQEQRAEKDLEIEKEIRAKSKAREDLELELDKELEKDKEPEKRIATARIQDQSELLLEDCFELYKDTFRIIVDTEKRTFNRLSKEYTLEFLYEAIYKTTLRTFNGIEIKNPMGYVTALLKEWDEKGYQSIDEIEDEQEMFNEKY